MQNANVSISGEISYEVPYVALDFIFEETSSNTGEVIDYIGTDRDIVIPSSYSILEVDGEEIFVEGDDYTVTAIADGTNSSTGVFFGDNLTNLKIFLPKLVLYGNKTLINTSKNASIFCNRCKKF